MWGGRFADGPSAIMREINASIPFDKRLWQQDIAASRAHVAMLGKQGIVDASDIEAIDRGLAQIAREYAADARGAARELTRALIDSVQVDLDGERLAASADGIGVAAAPSSGLPTDALPHERIVWIFGELRQRNRE